MPRLIALGAVPMTFGIVGAWIDERTRLGFSTWRSACRAAGLAPASVLHFTLELLPTAVAGFLLGGLALLALGFFSRRSPGGAHASAAAHAGCAAAMPVGMLLCATGWPIPVLLVVELALAVAIAFPLLRAASVRLRTGTRRRA